MSTIESPILLQELTQFEEQIYLFTDLSAGTAAILTFIKANPFSEITVVSSTESRSFEESLQDIHNVSLSYDLVEPEELETIDRIAFAVQDLDYFGEIEAHSVQLRIASEFLTDPVKVLALAA